MKNRLLQLLAAAAFLFFSAALIIHFTATREVKQTVRDLAEAKGKITAFSFLEGGKGTGQYTIHLSGYTAAFQVPPEDVQYFAKDRFEKNLKKGDTLSVTISPDSAARLTSTGPVPIFAARTDTATYLDEYYTLGANNSGFVNPNKFPVSLVHEFLWAGVACVILWVVGAIANWIRSRKPSEQPRSRETSRESSRESVFMPDGAFISASSQRLQQLVTKAKPSESEAKPAFTECTLAQIPVVFEQLRQKGHDGSFVIFTLQPPATSNPDDAISLQFSIENGRVGFDWCLNGPANIRDKDKLEGFLAAQGQRPLLLEMNQVKYLRVEQGNLPLLCQSVVTELYAVRFNIKLDLAVQGFPWPPEPPPLASAGDPGKRSQEPATAQLT